MSGWRQSRSFPSRECPATHHDRNQASAGELPRTCTLSRVQARARTGPKRPPSLLAHRPKCHRSKNHGGTQGLGQRNRGTVWSASQLRASGGSLSQGYSLGLRVLGSCCAFGRGEKISESRKWGICSTQSSPPSLDSGNTHLWGFPGDSRDSRGFPGHKPILRLTAPASRVWASDSGGFRGIPGTATDFGP